MTGSMVSAERPSPAELERITRVLEERWGSYRASAGSCVAGADLGPLRL
jgi:hypothetical protein